LAAARAYSSNERLPKPVPTDGEKQLLLDWIEGCVVARRTETSYQAKDIARRLVGTPAQPLASQMRPQSAVQGWVLVPVDCTVQMMKAFWKAGPFPEKGFMAGWHAALAAAPQPPQGEGNE
jgi:hypothetical protein